MTPKDYIKNALKTERNDYDFGTVNGVTARTEHAVMGIVTEEGELMDQLKKAKIYRKDLDKVNLIEEIGDVFGI